MREEKIDYSKVDFTKEIPFIRKRCPHLNEEELREAEDLFRRWVELAMEIYDEAEKEGRLPTEEEIREDLAR